MNKTDIEFFEQYNKIFADAYNSFLFDKQKECDKEQYLEKYIDDWANKANEKFDNISPKLYLESLSYEQLQDMFSIGAKVCDDYLPDMFLDLFLSHNKSNEYLISLLEKDIDYDEEEDIYVIIASIKALAQQKNKKTIEGLIDLMIRAKKDEDIIREEIRDSLIIIGDISVPQMIKNISNSIEIKEGHEYLLMAIAELTMGQDDSVVYSCLRESFKKMDNKIIGAHNLAKTGRIEAIPLLRNYIINNKDNLDKITFYEIVKAIQLLGGEIETLQYN